MRGAHRILALGLSMLLAAAAAGSLPAVAWAQGDSVEAITITGDELAQPRTLLAADAPDRVDALYREVSWLAGRSGTAGEPDADTLGPRFVLDIHVDGEVRYRYELYPQAEGGPRVFRPEEQPGERTTEPAWFYGRLSMPDTLYAAGIDVPGAQPQVASGTGGGDPAPAATGSATADGSGVMAAWREGVLLTALVTLGIVIGLALVALLIRGKV